jgi:hypothetical protein
MNESENAQKHFAARVAVYERYCKSRGTAGLGKLQFCSEIARVLWLASA